MRPSIGVDVMNEGMGWDGDEQRKRKAANVLGAGALERLLAPL